MPLSIRNSEVEALARDLAQSQGTSLTAEILLSLQERRARLTGAQVARKARLLAVIDRVSRLPVLDQRGADEILGYGAEGVPR